MCKPGSTTFNNLFWLQRPKKWSLLHSNHSPRALQATFLKDKNKNNSETFKLSEEQWGMSDAAQTHEQSLQETACVDIHDTTEPGCCLLWNIHTRGVLKTHVLIGGAFIHIEAVKNIKKQNSLLYLQLVGWTFLERWACTSFWKRDGRVILFSGLNTRKDHKDDLLVCHCSIQTFTLMCCDPAADVILNVLLQLRRRWRVKV